MTDVELKNTLREESPPVQNELIISTGSLRSLRVSKGLSLHDVEVRLKYPAKLIDALEAERFESLPRGLPLKSLVKNYAKLLEIDSRPLEAMLEPYIGSVQGGIANHLSTRTLGAHEVEQHTQGGSVMWFVLILILALVAAGVAVWQGLIPSAWLPAWLGAWTK
jgi:cytoskeletal protein RodZ